jgi:hypothetical protein
MKWTGMIALLMVSSAATADILPTRADTRPSSPASESVQHRLEKTGISPTEAYGLVQKLEASDVEFLASAEKSAMIVGSLLPEEWIGSAIWFYATAPYIDMNLHKYILNDSFKNPSIFNWTPFR